MNIVDGKVIAEKETRAVQAMLKERGLMPRLCIITCAPNRATESYLALKERIARSLGVHVEVERLPSTASTADAIAAVEAAAATFQGVIVQLPLPPAIDTTAVLEALPKHVDVDNFSYEAQAGEILPPVVYAIDRISTEYQLSWLGKKVVIFGAGRLVGLPVYRYARALGAVVTVVTESTNNETTRAATQTADIIVLGVGKSRLLTKDMVQPGVVVFDAGASEDGGVLVGDADPEVAEVAALFTPVPGGIGPITVIALFRNLVTLALRQ